MKNKFLKGLVVSCVLSFSGLANAGLITYTNADASDLFTVPYGVTEIRVLAIGGGGGGANGHQGGGGAGFLSTGIFSVNALDSFEINVGSGGLGAQNGSNTIVGLTAGGTSSFGDLLDALGGGVVTGINQGGHNGSSGGGAACNAGSLGGKGGTGEVTVKVVSQAVQCQSDLDKVVLVHYSVYSPKLCLLLVKAVTVVQEHMLEVEVLVAYY